MCGFFMIVESPVTHESFPASITDIVQNHPMFLFPMKDQPNVGLTVHITILADCIVSISFLRSPPPLFHGLLIAPLQTDLVLLISGLCMELTDVSLHLIVRDEDLRTKFTLMMPRPLL